MGLNSQEKQSASIQEIDAVFAFTDRCPGNCWAGNDNSFYLLFGCRSLYIFSVAGRHYDRSGDRISIHETLDRSTPDVTASSNEAQKISHAIY